MLLLHCALLCCVPRAAAVCAFVRLRADSHQKHQTTNKKTKKSYKLNIWDVGGQRTLRPYWRNYFEKTDGLIWVVDSSDRARLADAGAELAALLREERLFGATLLVLANKRDIEGALSVREIEDALGLAGVTKRHWRIVGCSAHSGEGLKEGLGFMVKDVSSRIYLFDA